MAKDIFHDREQAEEAAYFQNRDAKLIEKLREKAKLAEVGKALAEKLQVDDPGLLGKITNMGVTLDTAGAFLLLPLIEVAWANGKVSGSEHDTILHMARGRGVEPGSAAHAQLVKWMEVRPSDELFGTALDAMRIGLSVLPRPEAEARVGQILESCEEVARASPLPKLLQLRSAVSGQEKSMLETIRSRLLDAPK